MFRSMTIVAALCVAGVSAQTPQDAQVSPDLLRQIPALESALVSAVTQAATKVTDRALAVVPEVKLRLEANPVAKGFPLPMGEGLFVVVEVPGIEATGAMLWSRLRELSPGVINAASTTVDSTLMTNPGKEYSDYTRTAIVDAMLDAITLSLKQGQTLTVSVGSFPDPTNPLASGGRRLYLTIKAEDLLALRQNTITRDEAKARIIEKRY